MQERNIFFSIARPPPEGLLAISPERSEGVIFFYPSVARVLVKARSHEGGGRARKKDVSFLQYLILHASRFLCPICEHAVASVYCLSGTLGIIPFPWFHFVLSFSSINGSKSYNNFFSQEAIWTSNFPNKVRYCFDNNLNARKEKSSDFFLNCWIAGKGKEKRGATNAWFWSKNLEAWIHLGKKTKKRAPQILDFGLKTWKHESIWVKNTKKRAPQFLDLLREREIKLTLSPLREIKLTLSPSREIKLNLFFSCMEWLLGQ